jgi:CRP-like cAMP-binding protein
LSVFACYASFGAQASYALSIASHFSKYQRALFALISPTDHGKETVHLRDIMIGLYQWQKPAVSSFQSLFQENNDPSSTSTSPSLLQSLAQIEHALWNLYHMTIEDTQQQPASTIISILSPEASLTIYRLFHTLLQSAQFKFTTQQMIHHRAMRLRLGGGGGSGGGVSSSSTSSSATTHHLMVNHTAYEIEQFFVAVTHLCILSRTVYLASTMIASQPTNETASSSSSSSSSSTSSSSALTRLAEVMNTTTNNNTMVGNSNQNGLPGNNGIAQPHNNKRAAVYDNVDMSKPYAPKIIPKTTEISTMLTKVVQQNILFRNFKSEEHASIVEAFECIHSKAGEIIIRQGDSGEYFYIIEHGKLDVFMESCGIRIKVGRSLTNGDYFGELALMYNTPRAATVVSIEASVLWRIDRGTYRSIVTHHNKITSDEFYQLASHVHILGKRLGDILNPAELNKVVSTLEIEEFEHESVIIRQHQTGDYFYIISEGQVDVWQESSSSNSNSTANTTNTTNTTVEVDQGNGLNQELSIFGRKVATLSRGDCFGEKALLADDVRQASCIAVGRVVCLSLSRDDFIAMIGSWQDVVMDVDVNQQSKLAAKKAKIRASVYDSQYHLTVRFEELEKLNTLGEGAFGRVVVARHKQSAQLYALKCQAKAFIVTQNMQEMIMNEAAIMKQIDHPLITKLHGCIQDRKYIYFLLELLPGGDFFSFLQNTGKMTEEKSRFYAASVVLALEELSKAKIAYRDLKPENMVLDSRGYVKLVDFGLAKQVLSGSTW